MGVKWGQCVKVTAAAGVKWGQCVKVTAAAGVKWGLRESYGGQQVSNGDSA
jgi:hypothetical protein